MPETGEAQLRRTQPHAFYSITGPMSVNDAKAKGLRVLPAFRCCETELMEDEAAGHDPGCPRQGSVT